MPKVAFLVNLPKSLVAQCEANSVTTVPAPKREGKTKGTDSAAPPPETMPTFSKPEDALRHAIIHCLAVNDLKIERLSSLPGVAAHQYLKEINTANPKQALKEFMNNNIAKKVWQMTSEGRYRLNPELFLDQVYIKDYPWNSSDDCVAAANNAITKCANLSAKKKALIRTKYANYADDLVLNPHDHIGMRKGVSSSRPSSFVLEKRAGHSMNIASGYNFTAEVQNTSRFGVLNTVFGAEKRQYHLEAVPPKNALFIFRKDGGEYHATSSMTRVQKKDDVVPVVGHLRRIDKTKFEKGDEAAEEPPLKKRRLDTEEGRLPNQAAKAAVNPEEEGGQFSFFDESVPVVRTRSTVSSSSSSPAVLPPSLRKKRKEEDRFLQKSAPKPAPKARSSTESKDTKTLMRTNKVQLVKRALEQGLGEKEALKKLNKSQLCEMLMNPHAERRENSPQEEGDETEEAGPEAHPEEEEEDLVEETPAAVREMLSSEQRDTLIANYKWGTTTAELLQDAQLFSRQSRGYHMILNRILSVEREALSQYLDEVDLTVSAFSRLSEEDAEERDAFLTWYADNQPRAAQMFAQYSTLAADMARMYTKLSYAARLSACGLHNTQSEPTVPTEQS